MQFGFSTMGDPTLSYAGAAALARDFDLKFLELRVLEGSLDLPGYFRAHPEAIEKPLVPVRVVATSFHLDDPSPAAMEECLAFADLATQLRAPYLRIFAARAEKQPGAAEIKIAAKTARELRAALLARGLEVELLLETHGGYSFSGPCVELNRQLEHPLALIWDTHHTWKIGGEDPESTWDKLGLWVRHVHYKDSVATPGSSHQYHYVLPGEGEFPTGPLLALLRRENFRGGFSFEWETLWHAELAPVREALPAFVKVVAA